MELFLDETANQSFLIELIVSYFKLEERRKVKVIHLSAGALKAQKLGNFKINIPTLITNQGECIEDLTQICQLLINVLPQWRQFFLGRDQNERAQIRNIKSNIKEGKEHKKHLQKYLEPRTFFVSNHLTLADFVMFTEIYNTLIEFTDEQKNQFHNIFRWYKHIQNLAQIKEYLNKSKRFLIFDPETKINFMVEKKKQKKDKKETQKTQKTETNEKVEKVDTNEKTEKTEKTDTKEKSEKKEKNEKKQKKEKTEKTEKTEKIQQTVQKLETDSKV